MKKLAGIVVAVLCVASVSHNALAERECKNKFDKAGASETKIVDAGVGPVQNLNLGFSTDGQDYFLAATCNAIIKAPPMELGPDTPMIITLDDGSELTVHPASETRAKRTFAAGAWNRKKTKTVYGVSREDVEKMAAAAITTVKMSYRARGEMESEQVEVKPENGESIRQLAGCILASDGR